MAATWRRSQEYGGARPTNSRRRQRDDPHDNPKAAQYAGMQQSDGIRRAVTAEIQELLHQHRSAATDNFKPVFISLFNRTAIDSPPRKPLACSPASSLRVKTSIITASLEIHTIEKVNTIQKNKDKQSFYPNISSIPTFEERAITYSFRHRASWFYIITNTIHDFRSQRKNAR